MEHESEINLLITKIFAAKTDDICRLCLKTTEGDYFRVSDAVVLTRDEGVETKTIADVISELTGSTVDADDAEFSCVCGQCTRAAIDCYIFLQQCKASAKQLDKVITMLTLCLTYSYPKARKPLSMFLVLKESTFRVIFDLLPSKTLSEARERVNTLLTYEKCKEKNDKRLIRYRKDKFHCIECKKNFTSQWHLDMHKKVHGSINCLSCNKSFTTNHKLEMHKSRFHSEKIYQCPECPKKYGSDELVQEHRAHAHSGLTYKCKQCGKSYTNKRSMHSHMERHKPKICPKCGKIYRMKETYLNHIVSCDSNSRMEPVKKFTCHTCNKAFSHKNTLKVHINFEHGTAKCHICEWCHKKFSAASRLKAHIVKHTKERNFKCTLCSGVFVTKEALVYHTRIHTGEKPYQCDQCPEKFLSASRRMNHIKKVHIGPKLQCDMCTAKFVFPATLRYHRLKQHLEPKKKQRKIKTESSESKKINENDLTFETNTKSIKHLESKELIHEIINKQATSDDENKDLIYEVDVSNVILFDPDIGAEIIQE